MTAIKITYTTEYCVRLEPGTFAIRSERHTTTPTDRMKSQGVEKSHVITHGKQTKPSGQGQGDKLFNPIITDFVKTSNLFHVIIIELKRQKHIYSIIFPESKKIMSSKINLNQ